MNTEKDLEKQSARERLLEAAIEIFGQHGYDGATTRMLAAKAGVNIAAIPYYFNGKQGLYDAMIAEVITMVQSHLGNLRSLGNSDFSGGEGRKRAKAVFEILLEKIILFMLGSADAPRLSKIILREQLFPTSAFKQIYTGFMEPMLAALTSMLVIISPNLSRQEARMHAIAMVGQIAIFRIARQTVVHALEMEGYSKEELAEIKQIILSHSRTILDAMEAA